MFVFSSETLIVRVMGKGDLATLDLILHLLGGMNQ